jgi:deoxyribonuclease-4
MPANKESACPPLGAHQSISGGYYKSVDLAVASTCAVVQIFTKNNNQWKGKPITPEEADRFKKTLVEKGITHPLSHDSYLINMAAPNDELWEKSLHAMAEELRRASILGIPYVVAHPGSYTSSSEEAGLQRIIQALDEVHDMTADISTITLLETTAGQGTNLGHRFEHIATIINGVKKPERLAVCVDTCHIFSAGYPITKEADYQNTFKEFDTVIGIKQIKAFHLNDSKKGLGSRVDRHEHIGKGEIGLDGFRWLMNDSRFKQIPMYLETPKDDGGEEGIKLDAENLAVLRSLCTS